MKDQETVRIKKVMKIIYGYYSVFCVAYFTIKVVLVIILQLFAPSGYSENILYMNYGNYAINEKPKRRALFYELATEFEEIINNKRVVSDDEVIRILGIPSKIIKETSNGIIYIYNVNLESQNLSFNVILDNKKAIRAYFKHIDANSNIPDMSSTSIIEEEKEKIEVK